MWSISNRVAVSADRYVAVFEPRGTDAGEWKYADAVLRRGDVVGVLMNAPGAAAFADSLPGLKIPVRVEGRLLVFGEPRPA